MALPLLHFTSGLSISLICSSLFVRLLDFLVLYSLVCLPHLDLPSGSV
jgi:hypothetical protein